jgi:cell division GTPase FtsZ
MKALAVDLDPNSLQQLRNLPSECRLFFPPIDPHHPFDVDHAIHVEEVMTRVQQMDTLQIDAILICCGLGGNLVQAAPQIIKEVRKAFLEPVFAVATIPCRSEGIKRSAKAYADVEMLRRIVDALILFDNELLFAKISLFLEEEKEITRRGPYPFLQEMRKILPENPRDSYFLMNERIARNIGLLLRAGEFNERGVEVAEVVLDAGEVLKTLTHMGMVSVGYAVEELEAPGWFSRFRSRKPTMENTQTRAARIVSLAKKAVYDESSISCDITSAEKALVLIAGPSQELSMRGFQTVRKWIDRSISGIEMRSGDYPVKNTRFIGIIIVLAGLQNIPRIEELRGIYHQCREEERSVTIMASENSPGDMATGGDREAQSAPGSPAISPNTVEETLPESPPSKPKKARKKESEELSPEIKKKGSPKKRSRRKKDEDFGLTWFR